MPLRMPVVVSKPSPGGRIPELVQLIVDVVGYQGKIRFDATRPDGMPRKLLDTSRLSALGWTARIPLATGIAETYKWYQAERSTVRLRSTT